MQQTEIEQNNIRGIHFSKEDGRAFHCIISIDTHSNDKDVLQETTGYLYTKALLAGCEGYTRDEFLTAVNLLGGSIGVSIDDSIVTITLTSLDTHQDKLIKLASLMMTKPTFAPKEITRIRELEINELHEEKEDAKSQSLNAFVNTLYGSEDRRYASSTDEVIKAVPKVQKTHIGAFHKRVMSGKWTFTFTSNSEKSKSTVSKLLKLRAQFPDVSSLQQTHSPVILATKKSELVSIPSKQNIEFNIGGSLPLHLGDADYHAFVFGLNVLGKWGGFAGRLMSTVREKEGLTYGIYAKTETISMNERGYWRIMTFFSPDKAIQGLTSTLREIKLIQEKGITEIEFLQFKTIIETGQSLLNDSIMRVVTDAHAYQVKGFNLESMAKFKKSMLDVTKKEVDQALKKYIDLSTLVIAGAGPVSKHAKEIKAL